MVYANGIKIDEQGNPTAWPTYGQYSLLDLLSMRIIRQPTVIMRRAIVSSLEGLNPSYHLLMDHHLWIRIAQVAQIIFVDEYWAGFRDHTQAKNTSQRLGFPIEARRIISEMSQSPELAVIIKQQAPS